MVKGHLTGCGPHGYSLDSLCSCLPSLLLLQVFLDICFVVSVEYNWAVEDYIKCELSDGVLLSLLQGLGNVAQGNLDFG